MIITDPVVTRPLAPSDFFIYMVEGGVAIGVIIVGRFLGAVHAQTSLTRDLPNRIKTPQTPI